MAPVCWHEVVPFDVSPRGHLVTVPLSIALGEFRQWPANIDREVIAAAGVGRPEPWADFGNGYLKCGYPL